MSWRVPFGDLKIGPSARKRIAEILDSNWVSEGRLIREFEERFADKFGWKHAIATSSGTDAGIVVWSAVREICGYSHAAARKDYQRAGAVFTPACAFVATANCLLASGLRPVFIDVDLDTLNLNIQYIENVMPLWIENGLIGIQFVATMGKPTPVKQIAALAKKHNLYLVGDWCEAHGAQFVGHVSVPGFHSMAYAEHACDASIYSFYCAHLIVGGEGGIICTDDAEIAGLCRSIKSHGRPAGSVQFDFQRPGSNSKWNDLCAAVALESLERFDETFAKRRAIRSALIDALSQFEDDLMIYRDDPSEVISPHAFPIVLRDENADMRPLYEHLDKSGIQVKTLFGSLPTDHKAFQFLGYKKGDFPVSERIGRTGLHFSCNEFMTEDDVGFIAGKIGEWIKS